MWQAYCQGDQPPQGLTEEHYIACVVQVASVEKRCVEKDQRLRDLNEDLKIRKTSLATKEGAVPL